MSDILKVYKTEIAWDLLELNSNGKGKGNFNFDLILLDDYSVMGVMKYKGQINEFIVGMCIPDVGFLFTMLNLEQRNTTPRTYTAVKRPDGSPDTYYGLIQKNRPNQDINDGMCVIRAVPKYMSSSDLDNYIDEIASIQDMLDNDQSSFVASYYNNLLTESVATRQINTIGKYATIKQNEPLTLANRRTETLLSKKT